MVGPPVRPGEGPDRPDQVERDLRYAGEDPRPGGGRRQHPRIHRDQALLTMTASVALVLFIVVVALAFDFINGFHDSANSIATVVGTRVLTPGIAVLWAAFFNFFAAFVISTGVAKTVSKGIVRPEVVLGDPNLILAALLGAIIWNLITWWLGLPTSSSHALIGGFGGAAVAKAGIGALIATGWIKTVTFIFVSPLVGMTAALLLTIVLSWLVHRLPARPVE